MPLRSNHLATLYSSMGDYASAEPLFLEARSIREKAMGPENEYAGWSSQSLGTLYHRMQIYKKAERFYKEAKAGCGEKRWGQDAPITPLLYAVRRACTCKWAIMVNQKASIWKPKQFRKKRFGKLHPDYARIPWMAWPFCMTASPEKTSRKQRRFIWK